MREIISDTLSLLKEIKTKDLKDKEKIEKSIYNLEFILSEYKRLIEEFIKKSSSQE